MSDEIAGDPTGVRNNRPYLTVDDDGHFQPGEIIRLAATKERFIVRGQSMGDWNEERQCWNGTSTVDWLQPDGTYKTVTRDVEWRSIENPSLLLEADGSVDVIEGDPDVG